MEFGKTSKILDSVSNFVHLHSLIRAGKYASGSHFQGNLLDGTLGRNYGLFSEQLN